MSVKDELRRNTVARLRSGEPIVSGLAGYEDSVLPQIENALLAGHDMVLLGERGQAKTRLLRALVELLDEWMPIVAGSEINDDPLAPTSRFARDLIAEHGDETPVAWVHRSDRYGEKLATPDTTIADLIGEVDPIKVAEGRYLSDELTLHYGLVPRTNRGIFAINELPDLAERIQVGLLNVLEERDIQVRGYKIRLPLDVVLVASANPEDYTNRGRIITPLKDRFGSQIRTHYPADAATEVVIAQGEAQPLEVDGLTSEMPAFMDDIVAEMSQAARASHQVSQRSGVSVRMTVANREVLVANAARRALRAGATVCAPRICDLAALHASTVGKIELDTFADDLDDEVFQTLVATATLTVFRRLIAGENLAAVVDGFDDGSIVSAGDDMPDEHYRSLLEKIPALQAPVGVLLGDVRSDASVASAIEFVLEGLHLANRLNKDHRGGRADYRGRR